MEIVVRKISYKKIVLKYHVNITSNDGTLTIKKDYNLKITCEYKDNCFSACNLQRLNNPIRTLSRVYAIKMIDINFLWKKVEIIIPEFGKQSINIPTNIVFKLPKSKIRDEKIKILLD